jgi:hypothetical protein
MLGYAGVVTRSTQWCRVAVPVALAILAMACATLALPDPDDANWAAQRWPGTQLADLEHGRHLYLNYCDGCHDLVLPNQRTVEQWPDDLRRMQKHVRIPEADASFVERFILSVRPRDP